MKKLAPSLFSTMLFAASVFFARAATVVVSTTVDEVNGNTTA